MRPDGNETPRGEREPCTRRSRQGATALICVAIAIVAIATERVATPHGLAISPDSVAYLATADGIAHGHGAAAPYGVNLTASVPALSGRSLTPWEPTTVFEPLYSAVLAPLLPTLGAQSAGRVLSAVCFALLLVLAGWVPYTWSGNRAALFLGPLLVLAAPDLLDVYVNVESEVLFLPLVLAGTFALSCYLERCARGPLAAAGVLIGAAVLTRYAGLGLIPGGALVVLLAGTPALRRRLLDAAIFASACGAPAAVWVLRNALNGSAAARTVAFHPLTAAQLHTALRAAGSWFAPSRAPGIVKAAAWILVMILVLSLAWRARRRSALQLLISLLVLCYLAGVVVSDTFLDASTGIDARILAPAHLLVLVGIGYLAGEELTKVPIRLRVLPLAVLVAFGALALARGGAWLRTVRHSSVQYADSFWQHSPLMATVRGLPPDVPIFTNAGDAVWFLDRRGTYPLPEVSDPRSGRTNDQLSAQLRKLGGFITARHAAVAFFTSVSWRTYLPSESMLLARLRLRVSEHEPDGVLLAPPA